MPDIDFVDYDAENISAKTFIEFEEKLGEILDDADERRVFLLALLQFITTAYHNIDETGRQNLLRYAKGPVLDAIGEDRGVTRLAATPAKTIIYFMLSAKQSKNTIIPEGTRVTPDGKLFFRTVKLLTIPAGELSGAVEAYCAEPGAKANGLRTGTIKTLVDPIPYIASVTNIEPTSGGADEELDDPYREHIRQKPESFTTTGTEESYIFWAMSASTAILDVAVTSPAPGEVRITVLTPPDDEKTIVADVEHICTDPKRRTFTDYVTVGGPEVVPFDIDVPYSVAAEDEAKVTQAIEGEGGAIDKFIGWQSGKLGREINPDYLNMLLIQNGAFKVDIRAPARQTVTPLQVARINARHVDHEVMTWT